MCINQFLPLLGINFFS